jgi:hypothetical protein
MPSERPHLTVLFEQAGIVHGGDIGAAEIYFEGWVDDGGGKKSFRIPKSGHIPEVHDGQTLAVDTVIWEGTPGSDGLHVHIEAWDEDLGRDSRINPDDHLGTYDHVFTAADRWGVGRHASIPLASKDGEWLLTLRIDAR